MVPFFSIIIPTYKRNDALAACLACLNEAAKQFKEQEIEVIVSDDYNASETISYLSASNFIFNLRIIEGPKKGPAGNRNNGARNAKGEWLIFTDDDCLPDKDLITNYYKAITQNNTVTVFEGKIITDREKGRYDEEAPVNTTGNNFWSCNICVKKENYFQVGGFDEKFPYPYMEDIDLYIRLKNNNNQVQFIESAFVTHPWRPKRGWTGYLKSARSILYFNEKNYSLLKHSKSMYLKIFLGGFPKRISQLFHFRFKGIKDFIQENIFLGMLSVKFYFKIAQLEKKGKTA